MDTITEEKLHDYFDEMVVYKDLKKSNFFKSLSLPAFLRDWVLKKFEDEDGDFDIEEITDFVQTYLPKKEDWDVGIKNRIILEYEHVKILTKIAVNIDIFTQEISFTLPAFDLSSRETVIEPDVWQDCKSQLSQGRESWGVVELGYRPPTEDPYRPGKIKLVSFTDFCPYIVDLDYYKDLRSEFSIHEWIDILMGAIDYNSSGYKDEQEKRAVLTRLLPFVEKRLNLMELAPKGTGKSYIYGSISKYGNLSAGYMTRAKLFYDLGKHMEGLVYNSDFIAFDEIQKMQFSDMKEMGAALQTYMENGNVTISGHSGSADAGIVLLGNIPQEIMDDTKLMIGDLPKLFHDTAMLDRFHGFIKGWDIPRMTDDMKISGWGLNSEYFCTILHLLRDDASYRAIVDEIVEYPEKSDTRDAEAVKRIATAYLKLLFPNVRNSGDVNRREFRHYCLQPAVKMRKSIRRQQAILDIEYKGKDLPAFTVKGEVADAE